MKSYNYDNQSTDGTFVKKYAQIKSYSYDISKGVSTKEYRNPKTTTLKYKMLIDYENY